MFRFKGFKASLNLNGKHSSNEDFENVPSFSITGAYKVKREEFYGIGTLVEPPKKLTPSMVILPPSKNPETLPPTYNATSNLKKTPDATSNLQVGDDLSTKKNKKNKSKEKDQKKSDKKLLAEQKEKEKLEAKRLEKEQKKQLAEQKQKEKLEAKELAKKQKSEKQKPDVPKTEKVKKEKEKSEKKKESKKDKDKQKNTVPAPPSMNPLAKGAPQYQANTLDSSISRTSGPPPYTEKKQDLIENQNDNTGNTSFGKPIDNSSNSWDIVSQHRQQVSRPVVDKEKKKQMVMDLGFNRPSTSSDGRTKSEA